jgi:hypothetical protein
MEPATLAEKRYRQYKHEKRKQSLKAQIILFIWKVLQAITTLLKKTKIIRKGPVETVIVE